MTSKVEKNEQTEQLLSFCEEVREQMISDLDDAVKEKIISLEEKLESNLTLTSVEKFIVLSTLGKYYRKVNNYDKAGNYSRQAIRLAKNVDNKYIEMIIDTYIDYATLEREYGQQSNARMELAKLLAFLDSMDYKDSYAFGVIFSILGKIALDEENMESGFTQLEKALTYFHKSVFRTHPIISSTIHTLSEAYIQVENYEKALDLHQQLLESYREDNDQVSEARTLLQIAEIQFYIDLNEARKTITKSIKLMDEIYKENHLDIAKAILMLAEIDENTGNFPRAINYYKQALEHLTSFYNEEHFMIVFVYSKIGTISLRTFKLNQAKEYLEKGLSLSTKFPKIRVQFLYALGKIYSDEKAFDKAYHVYNEFLQYLEKEGRKNSLAAGNTLQAIASNYLVQERMEDAFMYYNNALAIYENISNCKEEKGLTYIRLAYCYENITNKDINQAETYYEKGFHILEQTRNPELLEEAFAGIIDFFTRNNNSNKRRIYEEKFVEYQTKKASS